MSSDTQSEFFYQGRFCGTREFQLKHRQKHKKKGPIGKYFVVFSPSYCWNCILKEKFKDGHNQVNFFKIQALFDFQKRTEEASPTHLFSCTRMSVTEYPSISQNIPKYPWKCLNKLLWLCQGPKCIWLS